MADFMTNLKNEQLTDEYNVDYAGNGARGYATTGTSLLDFSFAISTYRGKSEQEIINDFMKAFYETPEYALKYLFYSRDIRFGIGERKVFTTILKELARTKNEALRPLLKLIPEYGTWKDMLVLLNTPLEVDVANIIKEQINEDYANMENNKPISLCAKWLPSRTSSKVTKQRFYRLVKLLGISERLYRKTLSKLRAYLKVVEVDMCANRWDKIDYNTVPSKANILYKNAFMKHDEKRRLSFLEKLHTLLIKGMTSKEVKINAKVAFPHEIVSSYRSGSWWNGCIKEEDNTLECMWMTLMQELPEALGKTLCVVDGSGSMYQSIPNSKGQVIDVSHALGLACAEKLKGTFHNKYITFGGSPKLVELPDNSTLRQKLVIAAREDDPTNTNIEKTFQLILDTAINNNMPQNEMPENILIISDMNFDRACSGNLNKSLFTNLQTRFENAGYKMPRLIFWNVNVGLGKGVIPCIQNELGVILMSGFSQNLFSMICNNETNPWNVLKTILDSERYAPIVYHK